MACVDKLDSVRSGRDTKSCLGSMRHDVQIFKRFKNPFLLHHASIISFGMKQLRLMVTHSSQLNRNSHVKTALASSTPSTSKWSVRTRWADLGGSEACPSGRKMTDRWLPAVRLFQMAIIIIWLVLELSWVGAGNKSNKEIEARMIIQEIFRRPIW